MATIKHTPGPWGLCGTKVIGTIEQQRPIATVEAGTNFHANARLIAAAPEMLAALRDLAAACDQPATSVYSAADRTEWVWRATKAARAAIAKATKE